MPTEQFKSLRPYHAEHTSSSGQILCTMFSLWMRWQVDSSVLSSCEMSSDQSLSSSFGVCVAAQRTIPAGLREGGRAKWWEGAWEGPSQAAVASYACCSRPPSAAGNRWLASLSLPR